MLCADSDSTCPVCITPFPAILAEEEMALVMESPAHAFEEMGVTRLWIDSRDEGERGCGHLFCRRWSVLISLCGIPVWLTPMISISKWIGGGVCQKSHYFTMILIIMCSARLMSDVPSISGTKIRLQFWLSIFNSRSNWGERSTPAAASDANFQIHVRKWWPANIYSRRGKCRRSRRSKSRYNPTRECPRWLRRNVLVVLGFNHMLLYGYFRMNVTSSKRIYDPDNFRLLQPAI